MGAAAYGSSGLARSLIRSDVVDVEMIQFASRAVAPERARIDLAVQSRRREQFRQIGLVVLFERLFYAVGAEAFDTAANKKPRFVDRVAQGFTGIAEHDEVAGLSHEG